MADTNNEANRKVESRSEGIGLVTVKPLNQFA